MIPAQGLLSEPDEMSYKGIEPILCGGGEPYPNPNTLTFVLQLLHVNFCTGIFCTGIFLNV